MGKAPKADSSRKPPEPTGSHAGIKEWMDGVMPEVNPIVKQLDRLIRKTIPELQYALKWKKAYYGLPESGWVVEMAAYNVSVNLVFFRGAEFDPEPPLGTTGKTRYVKVTSTEEAKDPQIKNWIEQAGHLPGWK